jgi:hypothetical protein
VPELAVFNALDYILDPVAICNPVIPMFSSSIKKAKERSGVVPISKIEFLLCVYFRLHHNESIAVGRCFNYTLQRLLAQLEVKDEVFFGCALESGSQGGQVIVCFYQVASIQIEAEELEGGGDSVGEEGFEGFEGGIVSGEVVYSECLYIWDSDLL